MKQQLLKLFITAFGLFNGLIYAQTVWTLDDCLNHIEQHPTVLQQAIETKNADAKILQAKGNFMPNLNAGIQHSYNFGSTINPATNSRASLNTQYDQLYVQSQMNLFDWSNFLELKINQLEKESFIYQVKAVQNELKLQVIHQFFVYQNAKAWANVLQNQIKGIDEQITRTEKEVEIGTRPKSDVYDIKANLGIIKENYLLANNSENIAKIELQRILNLDENTEFTRNENAIFLIEKEEIKNLVQNQPQILALENDIRIQEKKIKHVKSQYLPTLSANYQWSTFYSKVLNSDTETIAFQNQLEQNNSHYVGLGLNIPVFNRFQIKTQKQMAENNQAFTELALQKATVEIQKSLEKIVANYQNALEKYELNQQNFENQQKSYERSVEKFNEGLMDAYTFFIVRNNWQNANYNLIQAKNDVLMQQKILKIFIQK